MNPNAERRLNAYNSSAEQIQICLKSSTAGKKVKYDSPFRRAIKNGIILYYISSSSSLRLMLIVHGYGYETSTFVSVTVKIHSLSVTIMFCVFTNFVKKKSYEVWVESS